MKENHKNLIQEFYNPIYDEVMIIRSNIRIPAKTRRKTRHYNKAKDLMIKSMKEHRENKYFYTGKILVCMQICGSEKYLKNVDIDNVVKYMLDVMTGIIYKNDKQVFILVADKSFANKNACIVGFKMLSEDSRPMFPYLPILSYQDDMWSSIRQRMNTERDAHYLSLRKQNQTHP